MQLSEELLQHIPITPTPEDSPSIRSKRNDIPIRLELLDRFEKSDIVPLQMTLDRRRKTSEPSSDNDHIDPSLGESARVWWFWSRSRFNVRVDCHRRKQTVQSSCRRVLRVLWSSQIGGAEPRGGNNVWRGRFTIG